MTQAREKMCREEASDFSDGWRNAPKDFFIEALTMNLIRLTTAANEEGRREGLQTAYAIASGYGEDGYISSGDVIVALAVKSEISQAIKKEMTNDR